MNPAAVIFAMVAMAATVTAVPPLGRGILSAPLANTIAASNAGASGAAAAIANSNAAANANAATVNDANSLARQINQQVQRDQAAAGQGAVDQRRAIRLLAAVSQTQAVNQHNRNHQDAINEAAVRNAAAAADFAAAVRAINAGASRDAAVSHANAAQQVAAINANSALANSLFTAPGFLRAPFAFPPLNAAGVPIVPGLPLGSAPALAGSAKIIG